jgi:hypothetical protein
MRLARILHGLIAVDVTVGVLFISFASFTDLRLCRATILPAALCSHLLAIAMGIIFVGSVSGSFVLANRITRLTKNVGKYAGPQQQH